MMTDRRYDDREVALILKAATETAVQGPGGAHSGDGLTLAELKEAAAEVGLDPGAIERAAHALDLRSSAGGSRWIGGAVVTQHEQVVDAAVSEQDHGDLVLAIRRAMGRHGVASPELDGLEWRARDALGGRYVSVRPDGARTLVRVLGNFRDGVGAIFAVGGTMGLAISMAVLKKTGLLALLGWSAAVPIGLAMYVPAWLFWRWRSRREAAALRRTLQAVVEAIERRQQPLLGRSASDPEP